MIRKHTEKELAIQFRKKGYSYSEILNEVKVAKSTLSCWLKEVKLAKPQKQRITEKRRLARLKAVRAVRNKRLKITKQLIRKGIKDIGKLDKKSLFIIGTALYWAEGGKQKENNVSQRVSFSNSDIEMVRIFLKWLKDICGIEKDRLVFEIYLHEVIKKQKGAVKTIVNRWRNLLKIPSTKIIKIRYKKNKLKKRPVIENYYGVFRVDVQRSTNLNRLITGWTKGIIKNY